MIYLRQNKRKKNYERCKEQINFKNLELIN